MPVAAAPTQSNVLLPPLPPGTTARSMLLDLFGDFAGEDGRSGRVRLQAIIRIADDVGISDVAARAAARRAAEDGWLTAERCGRETVYWLSASGEQLLEGGRQRIFGERRSAWDGAWYLVALAVPEARRGLRDRIRRELTWLGFGSPSTGLYLSPWDHAHAVLAVADQLGATDYVQVYRAAVVHPNDQQALVARAWSGLAHVNGHYTDFLGRFSPLLEPARSAIERHALADQEAFRLRFALVNRFRKCVFADPELPEPLLPADWRGGAARRLFERFHALVTPGAMRHFDAANSGPA
jgi:phenylacetic acid degradation operon negative regulatory protein